VKHLREDRLKTPWQPARYNCPTVKEPDPIADVKLIFEDHHGTHLLPFPCRRVEHRWRNDEPGEKVQTRVIAGGLVRNKKGRDKPDLLVSAQRSMLVLPQSNDQDTQCLSGTKIVGRTLSAAIVFYDVKAHLLAFGQSAQAGTLDGRDMNENIRPAVVGLDEAEAFGRIEELYSSDIHDDSFQSVTRDRTLRVRRCVHYRSILEEEDRQMRRWRENKVQPQDR
jgi:hypothetical protein